MSTSSKCRFAGDATSVDLAEVEAVFKPLGAELHYPMDEELEVSCAEFDFTIYASSRPPTADGSWLLGGSVVSTGDGVTRTMARLAALLGRAGAAYNLEYRPLGDNGPELAIRHPHFLAAEVADQSFVFELGQEHAPDSHHGMHRVTVAGDGSLLYENWRAGRLGRCHCGSLASVALTTLQSALALSRFPHVPSHPCPPGGSYLTIRRATGDGVASLNVAAVKDMEGYAAVVSFIARWTSALFAEDFDAVEGELTLRYP